MTSTEEYVSERFTALEARFRASVEKSDFRLRSISGLYAHNPASRLLDLGCGKGRFASKLAEQGHEVVGLDPSYGMIRAATGIDRVRASARRLPLATGSFDGAFAVEVFEHLDQAGQVEAIEEMARVVKPGGLVAIVDKNAGAIDARRPWLPSLVVKWVDERRGRWMYPAGAPFRERWFWPRAFAACLKAHFDRVRIEFLISPEELRNPVHRAFPGLRLYTLWTATRPRGGRLG